MAAPDDEVKTRIVSEPAFGPDQVSEPSEEVSETEEVCWLWPSEANDDIARPVWIN